MNDYHLIRNNTPFIIGASAASGLSIAGIFYNYTVPEDWVVIRRHVVL